MGKRLIMLQGDSGGAGGSPGAWAPSARERLGFAALALDLRPFPPRGASRLEARPLEGADGIPPASAASLEARAALDEAGIGWEGSVEAYELRTRAGRLVGTAVLETTVASLGEESGRAAALCDRVELPRGGSIASELGRGRDLRAGQASAPVPWRLEAALSPASPMAVCLDARARALAPPGPSRTFRMERPRGGDVELVTGGGGRCGEEMVRRLSACARAARRAADVSAARERLARARGAQAAAKEVAGRAAARQAPAERWAAAVAAARGTSPQKEGPSRPRRQADAEDQVFAVSGTGQSLYRPLGQSADAVRASAFAAGSRTLAEERRDGQAGRRKPMASVGMG